MMFIFENLLRNEYFPSELPPCFNTEMLADKSGAVKELMERINYNDPSVPLTFSGFKNSNARRKFGIPNPYHYCKAIKIIVDKQEDIFNLYAKSKSSITSPKKATPKKKEAYCRQTSSIKESKEIIEKLYQNNMFEVRLDIASFFDSVYTHSIPWAIHTKAIAKRNKDKSLLGNAIDASLQSMNYGQTNGILVGNAFSRIVSEMILCVVDEAIHTRMPNITYKRYVDDYYIYAQTSLDINNIVSTFRSELAKYELTLNENKIQINESPFIYGKPWVEQMKEYLHLKPDILINKMIIEYRKYKDVAILKYGLRVVSLHKYNRSEWKHIQSILVNLWVRFPELSDIFIMIFKSNEELIQKTVIKKAIYSILDKCLQLNYDQEVIWAVWFVKVFNIEISQDYVEKLLKSRNWLAIVIMLDIIKIKKMKARHKIKRCLEDLYDEILLETIDEKNGCSSLVWTELWLLAYEIDINKWLNINESKCFQFARKDEFFNGLRKNGIDFYNSNYCYNIDIVKVKERFYVTKQEFDEVMDKLQKSINSRDAESSATKIKLTNEEKDLVETIHRVISMGEY